jgi:hypothetical protein
MRDCVATLVSHFTRADEKGKFKVEKEKKEKRINTEVTEDAEGTECTEKRKKGQLFSCPLEEP